jgi:hypothetical protein
MVNKYKLNIEYQLKKHFYMSKRKKKNNYFQPRNLLLVSIMKFIFEDIYQQTYSCVKSTIRQG